MKLLKRNWTQDVVYLYQFKRSPYVPNMSPFCMKVELFLRANKINHEVIESTTKGSPKGLLPFVEINGKQIADSEFIVNELAEKFNIHENVSKEKSGTLRALTRLFDEEVMRLLLIHKVQSKEFVRSFTPGVPGFLAPLVFKIVNWMIKRKLKGAGYGGHTDAELKAILLRDLHAATNILGDSKFYGGEQITMADCSVFGQLASIYFVPFETEAHGILRRDFPTLVKYIENVAAEYFSDIPCGGINKKL